LKDDLEGAAYLALCQAGETADTEHNPAQYFTVAIDRAILNHANEINALGASNRTQRRAANDGRPMPRELAVGDEFPDRAAPDSHNAVEELRELIYSVCHDDKDREIVRLKDAGNSASEVAQQMGIGVSTVYLRLQGIEERFDAARDVRRQSLEMHTAA